VEARRTWTEECVSIQLESRHYFRARDTVQHLDGQVGTVMEGFALYAIVAWGDGRTEEIDQFDPFVAVVERAEPA
jgi:hypothetical protein